MLGKPKGLRKPASDHPRGDSLCATDDHNLTLTFANDEVGEFDVSPYLDKGIFQELRDLNYFKQVRVALGTVVWPHEQDFCPDTLYEASRRLRVVDVE